MFEIINHDKKQISICLHLEEIYIEICSEIHIEDQEILFNKETLSKSCVDYLVDLKFSEETFSDYECFVDFSHIKYIMPNSGDKFFKWINSLPNVKAVHYTECDFSLNIRKVAVIEENKFDYRQFFNEFGKKYVKENCCSPKGYTTQIGIKLGVYIDLKRIINDTKEILRWCYIIAYDLNKYFTSVCEDKDKRTLFFCHTMNGAHIAGILSQLLGYDLVYVDHLGPYNKLNKVDFYKGKSRAEEFIVIADLVCLGNEFLRAKNIVEYLGGSVKGCVGMMQMNISTLPSQYRVNMFAIEYTPQSAQKELNYSIQTELCFSQCGKCGQGEEVDNGNS